MKNDQLSSEEMAALRRQSLLSENEFAYRAGDLIVAENPVTGDKRIVCQAEVLKESNRRVLKG